MNQQHLEELVARSLDRELNEQESQFLEQALVESSELRDLRDDLIRIRDLAALPVDLPTPEVPAALSSQVETTYKNKGRLIAFPAPAQAALALAALVLLSVSIYYFPQLHTSVDDEVASHGLALSYQLDASQRFHSSIQNLEFQAGTRMASLPADLTQTYAHHLVNLNNAIRQCEVSLRSNPTNTELVEALNHAYRSKTELLQAIVMV